MRRSSSSVKRGRVPKTATSGDSAVEVTEAHIEQLSETEAIVEVSRNAADERSVSFSFKSTEEFAKEIERKQNDRATEVEKVATEKFRRRIASEDETLTSFKKLGADWFSVGIGFLKVVPDLTDRNSVYVREEVAASVAAFAETVARSKSSIVDENGVATERFVVALDDLPIVLGKMGRSMETMHVAGALSKSSLGALISDYEAFISNLIRSICGLRQGILISDNDTVQIGSLSNFSTFDELIDDLLDDKIQELLQGKTHIQVLKWIEEKLSVNLTSDKDVTREFVEICQRRNLLIHAGGRVNKKYRKICLEEGWKPEEIPQLGESIDVSRRYLQRATARVFLIGFFTLHIIWQKILPKRREESLQQLLSVSHDFVDNGLTKMCRRVCHFALSSDKAMPAKLRAYFAINLAQSYLFDPDIEEEEKRLQIEQVIKSNDWSMATSVVQLALKCIKRDFSNAEDCLDRSIAEGLSYRQVMTWSVFRELRTQDRIMDKIRARAALPRG